MTHEDAGKYSAKHPAGTRCDAAIAAALDHTVDNARVSCTAAHMVARDLGVTPSEVGRTADLLEYRIIECQLGLFGYPAKKVVGSADVVSAPLRGRLVGAAVDDQVTCAACWEIARSLGLEKMEVSAACERLGLKIGACQLGAF